MFQKAPPGMLFGKSELGEKSLFWECKFYALDLGIRLLQMGLDVSVNPGDAIACYSGKGGKKLLAIRTF